MQNLWVAVEVVEEEGGEMEAEGVEVSNSFKTKIIS